MHAQKEAEDARVRREQAAAEVRAEQIERQLAAQQRAAEEEARKRQLEEMVGCWRGFEAGRCCWGDAVLWVAGLA